MQIAIPWFNNKLNPNNQSHWAIKAKLKAKQKNDCYYIALEAGPPDKADIYNLSITFHPPDKRNRDIDNSLSAIKSGLDGIAMAWKINDKQFRYNRLDFGEVIKNGNIIININ
jgi:crossover junction endodeoxyribonuclease RusA